MNIQTFTFNLFQQHTRVISSDGERCIIIDPGFYSEGERAQFFDWFEGSGMKAEAVFVTHGHVDHIWGVKECQDRLGGIPVYMSTEDSVEIDHGERMSRKLGLVPPRVDFDYNDVTDGQILEYAGMTFKAIATPGHSRGGICYLEENEKVMFTGDTLFAGTIGRTDFEHGDYDSLIRSIMEKLIFLDGDIAIYPGHGPSSTIARERTTNPFLEPFNEKEELEGLAPDELAHD